MSKKDFKKHVERLVVQVLSEGDVQISKTLPVGDHVKTAPTIPVKGEPVEPDERAWEYKWETEEHHGKAKANMVYARLKKANMLFDKGIINHREWDKMYQQVNRAYGLRMESAGRRRVARKVLEGRLKLVEGILAVFKETLSEAPGDATNVWDFDYSDSPAPSAEKSGFLKNLGKKFRQAAGRVKPAEDMDDPQYVHKLMFNALKTAKKHRDGFKQETLNTSKTINAYHDAVNDALNKFNSSAESLPDDMRGPYERHVIKMVKNFHDLLQSEKQSLDAYLSTVNSELQAAGYNPAILQNQE